MRLQARPSIAPPHRPYAHRAMLRSACHQLCALAHHQPHKLVRDDKEYYQRWPWPVYFLHPPTTWWASARASRESLSQCDRRKPPQWLPPHFQPSEPMTRSNQPSHTGSLPLRWGVGCQRLVELIRLWHLEAIMIRSLAVGECRAIHSGVFLFSRFVCAQGYRGT